MQKKKKEENVDWAALEAIVDNVLEEMKDEIDSTYPYDEEEEEVKE